MVFAELVFPGWNPVAFHLGPLAVRWYGLAYLAGFLVAGALLDKLVRDRFLPLTTAAVSDLVGWLVLGVLLGGRLGYALFYEPAMLLRPLDLIEVWEGGLSFHGGLTGVLVASAVFARRRGIAWRRLADGLVLAAPVGILLVRITNFLNGELFGRVAPAGLPWGMRFPTDPAAAALSPELARAGSMNWHDAYAALRASGEWAALAPHVPLRHPSQLYECLLEGAVLGGILWTVYLRRRATLRPGTMAALFLLLYAAARFLIEFTRQPDPQFVSPSHPLGTVLGPFSMGQVLSLLLAAGGVVLLRWRAGDAAAGRSPPASRS
ncbi:MAG TPA: prolipoprotein diacylglyceryl transferase [Gemmatimonadales bacterium]|nr:prolipoprotein diacylglyceryl transferase [Gemmatimonadales bacterium]